MSISAAPIEKGIFVNEIKDGQEVQGLFLIKEVTRAETKNGNPYLILQITDRTGEISGRIWNDAEKWLLECQVGEVARISGLAQAYRGTLQLKIHEVSTVSRATVAMEYFLPSTSQDVAAMAEQIVKFAKSVGDPFFRKLLLQFFSPNDFFAAFQRAPAAKRMHHAYMGGLLEHTLAVARLADAMAKFYSPVDRSLLLTGALLHDVGKVSELAFDQYPFEYTDRGRLVGHLVLGTEMVQARIERIKDFPPEQGVWLKHLILSHHGQHEFGSPCLPMMLEAFVLHFLDDLDAKVNYLDRLGRQAQAPGPQWTEFQKTLGRFLLVRGHDEEIASPGPDLPETIIKGSNAVEPRLRGLWDG